MINNNKDVSGLIANNISRGGHGKPAAHGAQGKSFQDVLFDTVKQSDLRLRQHAASRPGLTVSKHARQRAEQRDIDIDGALDKLSAAVAKAAGKNLKSVLVLSKEAAFIVSVNNNVVVTAMSGEDMRESVITNIDGTVIV